MGCCCGAVNNEKHLTGHATRREDIYTPAAAGGNAASALHGAPYRTQGWPGNGYDDDELTHAQSPAKAACRHRRRRRCCIGRAGPPARTETRPTYGAAGQTSVSLLSFVQIARCEVAPPGNGEGDVCCQCWLNRRA